MDVRSSNRPAVSALGEYEGYSFPEYDGRSRYSFYLPMDDGVKIAVDYYIPTKNGVEETLSTILGVTAEELAVNAVKYAYKGKNDIDICLRLMDDKLVLRFRDNGAIFNPTEYIDDSGREVTGLSVVRSLTPDISYNRVLGFNVTVVSVNRKK